MRMNDLQGELKTSICMPSYENSYSIGVQYFKTWFLSKFNKDYFKSFHVGGKHVLDDYRNFSINSAMKKETPKAAMVVSLEEGYDRDNLDLYQFGVDTFVKRARLDKAFFRDTKKNLFINCFMEEMKMRCTFRIKVSEYAQQLRLYKMMQMLFSVKSTKTKYIDVDFHIPYSLMIQLAVDSGFKVQDNEIVDKIGFLNYVNRYSERPILMKYRNINGKVEYFLRVSDLYSHIYVPDDIQRDDGDQKGQMNTGYMLEMEVELKIPVPKFYAYYSTQDQSYIDPTNTIHDSMVSLDLCTIKIPTVPNYNDKGWAIQIRTDCEETDLEHPLTIKLDELFAGSEILDLINYNNSIYKSSEIFLDFKLFNNGLEAPYIIDWKTKTLTTTRLMVSYITNIYVYVNNEYINLQRIIREKQDSDRLRKANDPLLNGEVEK